MKERPITFSGPMVRAILEGRKTQTRRVVNPQPYEDCGRLEVGMFAPTKIDRHGEEYPGDDIFGAWSLDGEWGARCPYGAPGDRLWVKETWQYLPTTTEQVVYLATVPDGEHPPSWRSSRHMPRAASRVTLEVVSVRVERLLDISEQDAMAEGAREEISLPGDRGSFIGGFHFAWDAINHARPGCAWSDNPWVWVIEFKPVIEVDGGASSRPRGGSPTERSP